MILKQVILKNLRNFSLEKFEFNPFLTIILGENSKGKTNLLEAIHLIIHGSGFRETREGELIRFEENEAGIQGVFGVEDENFIFEVILKKKLLASASNVASVEKIFTINKSKKKYLQYLRETPKIVLFQPEQIEIITGSPEKRRRYFDNFLTSFDLVYKKRLINYENAIRQRNKILEKYRNELDLRDELTFWNKYLEEQGTYLTQNRKLYTDFLNSHEKIDNKEFSIEYLKNEFNQKRLEENFDLERRYRKTIIGPQKDDFQISQKDRLVKNLHHFGSRSEQRLGVFWLKFNEIKFIEDRLKIKPILLLDDIFSELDLKNKKLVIDLVRKYQTIVTTTEIELLELADMPKSIIKL
ncbi:hypothetical protein A3C98_05470 [Candidatus Roizmanbacteria bacterium RIFCSPHIGHO2_02_FULL_37_15]|uniref:DNA replication and repair protein RecF n=1 Tax=Candidatus Roizmanbacteria bacterium RIFCSPLOWO2_01_FULL_37_16 TaxID=1802058 RepID=A0A1F7IQ46_9BACT|nr:MAG: hypothetical protein A2859_00315 [Candidatus Roizmanbacteria bacterium RIFCSPHIGHO2_01_FULL_37_16b]OGK20368.1 MAG: hypothetical protein A3C98_05470 [Candidatus Roizmanbacteria bacterium RIFCSPHIGHO2_02_FULL_37_15]OGK34192.1 MAG: hypothetical protein A3F57_05805 [Candidatus Roizmanbacteria bacterium RIFCSPHIGHO2_12_FULL_36_11]OGK45490.1 MAG: hypothetical protein A3B40_00535 [Candidatus Roizmanbacteria bacterium RIFCSPLOWO2_01_FULL_37_16]OGK55697.1 MAG: hypothetical protein A3I50_02440 [C